MTVRLFAIIGSALLKLKAQWADCGLASFVQPSNGAGFKNNPNPNQTMKPPRKNPAAVALGRKGGQANTEAQNAARRRNGRKGGRPVVEAEAPTTDDALPREVTLTIRVETPAEARSLAASLEDMQAALHGDETIPAEARRGIEEDVIGLRRRLMDMVEATETTAVGNP